MSRRLTVKKPSDKTWWERWQAWNEETLAKNRNKRLGKQIAGGLKLSLLIKLLATVRALFLLLFVIGIFFAAFPYTIFLVEQGDTLGSLLGGLSLVAIIAIIGGWLHLTKILKKKLLGEPTE